MNQNWNVLQFWFKKLEIIGKKYQFYKKIKLFPFLKKLRTINLKKSFNNETLYVFENKKMCYNKDDEKGE